jgi:hypothetical protein
MQVYNSELPGFKTKTNTLICVSNNFISHIQGNVSMLTIIHIQHKITLFIQYGPVGQK